jgi:hypothetical protein
MVSNTLAVAAQTFHVGLNAADLDPFVFAIVKKLQFNALTKSFPELVRKYQYTIWVLDKQQLLLRLIALDRQAPRHEPVPGHVLHRLG